MSDYTPLLTTPQVRQLAIGMKVNGAWTPGLVRFSLHSNNYWAADTFTAVVGLDGTAGGNTVPGLPFWASQPKLEIELLASLAPAEPMTSIILGVADSIEWSADQQEIELRGRDYSSVFIDARSAEKYLNKTSAAIANTLASAHSLQANVQATTTKVGEYYHQDAVQMTDRITQWQLLTYLAQREGFNLWVSGRTLNFQPAPNPSPPPLKINFAYADQIGTVRANVSRLTCIRNLVLAQDIKVTVISWNHENKKPISATATSTKTKAPKAGGPSLSPASTEPAQTYTYRVPGLTQPQALAYAQNKLTELSKHERKVTIANLPMILSLDARCMIQVVGTLTEWDQQYFIDEIDRTFSVSEASMTIQAKNASPQATQTI